MNEKKIEEAARLYILSKKVNETAYFQLRSIDDFKAGAHWAIQEFLKDLWHDTSEEPVLQSDNESHVDCLVETAWGIGVRCWNPYRKCWDDEDADDYDFDMDSVMRWLYLDDLLPKQKGGE